MQTTSTIPPDTLRVDARLGKFAQACLVVLTALAFLLNQPLIVLVTAVIVAIAVFVPVASPFGLLYRGIVLPLHLLRPRVVEDDPAAHRFTLGIISACLVVSSLLLYLTPVKAVGWALDLLTFVMAGINLTTGFCPGCLTYYRLERLGLLPRVRYEGGFHRRGA